MDPRLPNPVLPDALLIQPVQAANRPWRVIGTGGDLSLAVSPTGLVRVDWAGEVKNIPMPMVVALQCPAAIEFMRHPEVLPFLYAAIGEGRIEAAAKIAERAHVEARKAWVARTVAAGLCGEHEAWVLSKLKFPAP